jgi:hypothetical protein
LGFASVENYDCPHGKPWLETAEQIAEAKAQKEKREAICEDCQHYVELDYAKPACKLITNGHAPVPCKFTPVLRGTSPPPEACPNKALFEGIDKA